MWPDLTLLVGPDPGSPNEWDRLRVETGERRLPRVAPEQCRFVADVALHRIEQSSLAGPRLQPEGGVEGVHGEVVAVEGREINELRPDVAIFGEEQTNPVEACEELEVLEIGVDVPEEIGEGETEEEELPEWKTVDENAYLHGEYTLYTKEVLLRGGRKQQIFFFSKKEKQDAEPCPKPEGYIVKVNKKTGLPVLKKAKK